MSTMGELSNRDHAVLRAVAAGRVTLSRVCGVTALAIDGVGCADQFAVFRLAGAELITPPAAIPPRPAQLTPTGRAQLLAAAAGT